MNIVRQQDVNLLPTNRIPRRLLTRYMGWFSPIEQRLVRGLLLRTWQWFAGRKPGDAKQISFRSVQDCFTGELKARARRECDCGQHDSSICLAGSRAKPH